VSAPSKKRPASGHRLPSPIRNPDASGRRRSGDQAALFAACHMRDKQRMATGTVKWFNDAKGYGFITQDGGGEEVVCHHTAIQVEGFRSLAEGQKVQFDVTKGPKGLQASNVRPL